MSQKVSFGSAAMAAVVVFALVILGWQLFRGSPTGPSFPPELSSIALPSPKPLQPFSLVDQEGQPFTLDRFRGHWTFLFFGYTHCPDICPMAMGLLGSVFAQLKTAFPQDLDRTEVAMVTVDPARDTPMVLKQYVVFFNPDFKGLTGSEEQIKAFSRQVGAAYFSSAEFKGGEGGKPPASAEENANRISHTSAFFLIDPLGRLVAIFPEYNNTEMIVEEYAKIRKFVRIRQIYANPDDNR